MFARPRQPKSRQRIGEVDHSFVRVAKPLVEHSSLNDMRANPLFDPPQYSSSSSSSSSGASPAAGCASKAVRQRKRQQLEERNSSGETGSSRDSESPSSGSSDAARPRDTGVLPAEIGYGHRAPEIAHRPKSLLGCSRTDQQAMAARNREVTNTRCGNTSSYSFNLHAPTYVDKRCARRMFRVLCVKHPTPNSPQRVLFDPLDGRIFSVTAGLQQRVSHNVLLYDTKQGALSERLPPDQVGAGKSGNGRYARLLCSFDVWGHLVRRYGGGPSCSVENAQIIQVVQFLDPPHPVPQRNSERYVEPYFFPTSDYTEPNRLRSDHHFKVNRFFTQD